MSETGNIGNPAMSQIVNAAIAYAVRSLPDLQERSTARIMRPW
ncbi:MULTISPECIES: hypothetical protein [unclassified Mesorhizobium]